MLDCRMLRVTNDAGQVFNIEGRSVLIEGDVDALEMRAVYAKVTRFHACYFDKFMSPRTRFMSIDKRMEFFLDLLNKAKD